MNETHHALLLEGTYTWAVSQLPLDYQTEGPDVVRYQGMRMGIDEVRALTQEAFLTPLVGERRVFILAYPEFTREAQNALLKLLEEPPQTAQFYIVTKRRSELLPTLASRLVHLATESEDEEGACHEDFFTAPPSERLAQIAEQMLEKNDLWATSLMNAFEVQAQRSKNVQLLKAVVELRRAFFLPGASKKMILEHLALML